MAAAASPTLDRIKASGTITFGYRDGAAPFSAKQRNGKVRGYSVELCEKVAAAVGSALKLHNIKVAWRARRQRDADFRRRRRARSMPNAGRTTITLSRMERVDFSVPIFVDGASALVRAKDAPRQLGDSQGQAHRRDAVDHHRDFAAKALALAGMTASFVTVKNGNEGVAAVLGRQRRRVRIGPDVARPAQGRRRRVAASSHFCRTISRSSRTASCSRATTPSSGCS